MSDTDSMINDPSRSLAAGAYTVNYCEHVKLLNLEQAKFKFEGKECVMWDHYEPGPDTSPSRVPPTQQYHYVPAFIQFVYNGEIMTLCTYKIRSESPYYGDSPWSQWTFEGLSNPPDAPRARFFPSEVTYCYNVWSGNLLETRTEFEVWSPWCGTEYYRTYWFEYSGITCSPPSKNLVLDDSRRNSVTVRYPDIARRASTEVFYRACQDLPNISTNNIANVLDFTKLVKDLLGRKFPQLPKDLRSLWLAYRYQFCTTKSDVKEIARSFPRASATLRGDPVKGHASLRDEFGNTWRCTVYAKRRLDTWDKRLNSALESYGINPDLQNIWDLVPFSFVVDWFLPTSQWAGMVDNFFQYSKQRFDFLSICYSVTEITKGNFMSERYERWPASSPPMVGDWYDDYSPSSKTWIKRSLDAAALFTERR